MPSESTKLLVRADDAGSSWAANMGCLRACTEGIARSVEVMMPCAWVDHAARLLGEQPQIDVGIHLTLTSEWDAVKWRPLTPSESLVDESGYFRPLLEPRDGDHRPSLRQCGWSVDDVAAEFRAQIELGLAKFPHASHVSCHMTRHFKDFDAALGTVVSELCALFGLKEDPMGDALPRMDGYPKHPRDARSRQRRFVEALGSLAGGTYIFVDHPAEDTPEMRATGHPGYEDVQEDRTSCLHVLTSPAVKEAVRDLGIDLVSYRSL